MVWSGGGGKAAAQARPVVRHIDRHFTADIEPALKVGMPMANALIRDFGPPAMLKEITGQQLGRAYSIDHYLSLFVS